MKAVRAEIGSCMANVRDHIDRALFVQCTVWLAVPPPAATGAADLIDACRRLEAAAATVACLSEQWLASQQRRGK